MRCTAVSAIIMLVIFMLTKYITFGIMFIVLIALSILVKDIEDIIKESKK